MGDGIMHMCAHEHVRECHTHACLNVSVCAGVLFAAGLPVPPVMLTCLYAQGCCLRRDYPFPQ